MSELDALLRDYYESAAEPVTVDEAIARAGTPGSIASSNADPTHRRLNGLAIAGVAATVIFLVVGGITVFVGGSSGVIESPMEPPSDLDVVPGGPFPEGALEVTDRIELGGPIPQRFWGTDRIVAAGGGLWVGVDHGDSVQPIRPGELFRIDPDTRNITDSIRLSGGVIDLVADPSTLWALVSDDTVVRVDLATLQVSHSIDLSMGIGRADSNLRSDMMLVGNGLWIAGGDGVVGRIDLDSLELRIFSSGGWGDGTLPIDMWLGEAAGSLWGLSSHDNVLVAFDPSTGEATQWEVYTGWAESYAVLGEGGIWINQRRRFDVETRTADLTTEAALGRDLVLGVGVIEEGGLWGVAAPNDLDTGWVVRWDAATGDLTDVIFPVPSGVASMTASLDGSIWVVTRHSREELAGLTSEETFDAELIQIDVESRKVIQRVPIPESGQVVGFPESIWIASEDGTLTRVGGGS